MIIENLQKTDIVRVSNFYSKHLKRIVTIDVFLPPAYYQSDDKYPVLYFNDGQDMPVVGMEEILNQLYNQAQLPPIVVVAIHTSHDRLQEYGTANTPDYKNRGSKAANYTDFVMHELLPYIHQTYRVYKDAQRNAFAGFSLGGLSAFDLVWQHPYAFSKVGVFSGSFWWRKKAYEDGYDDENDRIMHVTIRRSSLKKGLKFWLQVGTHDETDDRNNNGVIDAIDDTLDVIYELKRKGYKDDDIKYLCIEGGEHNHHTWRKCLDDFLLWAFATQ